ncbi:MAG TPA: restriction endonuclease subunit S [Prosthecobacter sp.]|nr:restriction endonuclease subunit S [Prosthecobacter sp.]HRK13545.1 restriction endonuclease subunit S [Prosthecobacter sp.]
MTIVGAGTGNVALVPDYVSGANITQTTARIAVDQSLADTNYVRHQLQSQTGKREVYRYVKGGAQPGLNIGDVEEFLIPLPPLPEQRKIADILTTWDEALTQLDALIETQERRKKALMQQLLTGRRRLKGFDQSNGKTASDRFGTYPADWKRVRLGEVTTEVPTKNAQGTKLPVLSCTKHRGLVLSEEYFGKRVYAEDTSGYRVVQRGEFAYATNHIEEGSIGYQNLCDAGLVSPIYTVFKTTEAVDDSYIFRVLKSTMLIHLYQINTSASVDRRGSLRYDEFSRIHIWLPGKEEQTAIAQVFDTADQQLTLLRTQRSALDQQKRGLMQRLLTGKLRVKP